MQDFYSLSIVAHSYTVDLQVKYFSKRLLTFSIANRSHRFDFNNFNKES